MSHDPLISEVSVGSEVRVDDEIDIVVKEFANTREEQLRCCRSRDPVPFHIGRARPTGEWADRRIELNESVLLLDERKELFTIVLLSSQDEVILVQTAKRVQRMKVWAVGR